MSFSYIINRLIRLIIVLICAWTLVFFLIRLTGDPTYLFVTSDASQAEIEAVRRSLGFDQPLYIQYIIFIKGALRGNMGESLRYGTPALQVVIQRLPATLELAFVSIILITVVGVFGGILAAIYKGSWWEQITIFISIFGQTVPFFWLGIMLQIFFSVALGWLPPSGRGTIAHIILPAITVSWFFTARVLRLTRASMINVLKEDYIRTAQSKGLSGRIIIFRHALPNAFLAIITIIGLSFHVLIGGAVVTETIFSWPGIGYMLVHAIFARDFPIVLSVIYVVTVIVVLTNFLIDLFYLYLDPRIKYK